VGEPAPDFTLRTVDGQTVSLSDFRGKPVMVNFWATWCGPCQVEMPLFRQAYTDHAGELVVLAVDVQEAPEDVRGFVKRNDLTFPVVLDRDGLVSTLYRVRGLPTTFFVDRDGIVVEAHRGALTTRASLAPLLAKILPGAPSP
jgi:peroxiredoxin